MEKKRLMIETIEERLVFLEILPAQGNFTDMLLRRELEEKLAITSDYLSSIDYQSLGEGRFQYNRQKDVPLEIELNAMTEGFLKGIFRKYDGEAAIKEGAMLSLFVKIKNI